MYYNMCVLGCKMYEIRWFFRNPPSPFFKDRQKRFERNSEQSITTMATLDKEDYERDRIRKEVDAETEKERERRTSIKLTDLAAAAAIDGKATTQEELLRKQAQRAADHATDEERQRRIAIDTHAHLNEQFSRERNVHERKNVAAVSTSTIAPPHRNK